MSKLRYKVIKLWTLIEQVCNLSGDENMLWYVEEQTHAWCDSLERLEQALVCFEDIKSQLENRRDSLIRIYPR